MQALRPFSSDEATCGQLLGAGALAMLLTLLADDAQHLAKLPHSGVDQHAVTRLVPTLQILADMTWCEETSSQMVAAFAIQHAACLLTFGNFQLQVCVAGGTGGGWAGCNLEM